MIQFEPKQ